MAKQSSYKLEIRTTTLGAAILDAFSELECLGEEMREWASNMEEKFSSTQKYEDVSNAADTLDHLSEPSTDDIPEDLKAREIKYTESVKRSKKQSPSRATRCGNAVAMLQSASEFLQGQADGIEDEDVKSNLTDVLEELDNLISEAEGIEFPGMY